LCWLRARAWRDRLRACFVLAMFLPTREVSVDPYKP
jgi:hypothetical protein